ncbi:MAR-binding filament-like protein 1-1 isoform X2 [Ziziphus jujuba]|uniref:MAR-binding filament-like protein 1-1 isoform X2 n=1 Tax=Ziziphus jujuba TaxID=326968 RepID=A0A6P3YU45_ZIZJJ|nr:MAR-binding filament-like protein 1-1 isoform X2 [Ziziphus jujuba]
MGFVVGSSCFLQPSLSHSPFASSSSSSSSRSIFVHSSSRNADSKRRRATVPMASATPSQEDPGDRVSSQRRVILLAGVSILPFLQLRARALEELPPKSEPKTPEEKPKAEQALKDTPPNSPLSLLNGLGIFSSGVLGAFYALAQKEKTATNATIESMKTKLKEKDAAIVSLEKNFETKLLNEQEERTKQIRKAMEEQQTLLNKLNSANSTITGLGQELKSEKRLIEELKFQVDSLETNLSKATEDKKALEENLKEKLNFIEVLQEKISLLSSELRDKDEDVQKLSSSLADKDLELRNMKTSSDQLKDQLVDAQSEIHRFKDELLENQKEIEQKNSALEEANATVISLRNEVDHCKGKLDAFQEDYNGLKLSSEKKAALDAKLLAEKEEELKQLKEKFELALSEASENKDMIADLSHERENLKKLLDGESSKVNELKYEVQVTEEALGKSRNEASDLEKQLIHSKKLCTELEAEVSGVRSEFAEVRYSLQKSLDDAKSSGGFLASELTATKEVLKKTKEQLRTVTNDLTLVVENKDKLQRELVDVYKRAESAVNDLKEERKAVSSLNNKVEALEKQILKDMEARKSLETGLEEARKSLDEMNQNALILSREVEKSNSRISDLEAEKELLYKSLTEQKNVSKEALENLEDAHEVVMKLGKDRESLDKRAKKLEEELASAKGEILRLRSQQKTSKPLVNNEKPQKVEDAGKVTVTAKRVGRRRKANSD